MYANFEEVLSSITQQLQIAGIDSPRLEARILLGHILNMDSNQVLFYHQPLSNSQQDELQKLLSMRLAHQPIDKIIGHKDFYKSTFRVNQDVLSPRPDTEILVENAIAIAKTISKPKILDLGTGSGCILLSILGDIPSSTGIGIDQSAAALKIAAANTQDLNLSSRATFLQADWFSSDLPQSFNNNFDIIVANPPYIPSSDIATLSPEVKNFDPLSALDGGADGLCDYRQIALLSTQILTKGGYIFLEIGINQASDVTSIFIKQGFSLVNIIKDLQSIERCIILKK